VQRRALARRAALVDRRLTDLERVLLLWAWAFVAAWPAPLRVLFMTQRLGSDRSIRRAIGRLRDFGWVEVQGDPLPGQVRLYVWRVPNEARAALSQVEDTNRRQRPAKGRTA